MHQREMLLLDIAKEELVTKESWKSVDQTDQMMKDILKAFEDLKNMQLTLFAI